MSAQVRIHSFGNRKINAIKIVREMTGYGLRESKDAVEQGQWFRPHAGQLERGCEQLRAIGCELEVEGSGAQTMAGARPTDSIGLTPGNYVLRVVSAPRKIHAIKLVRELDGSGLREAKETVECHRPLARAMTREQAERALARFVEIGAEVRIEPADAGSGPQAAGASEPPSFSPAASEGRSAWDDEDDDDF